MAEEVRFVADRMLGRLARWLRILGYDTLYPRLDEDRSLIGLCRAEGRVLLTRDTHFLDREDLKLLFIKSNSLVEQLHQVVSSFRLEVGSKLYSRCTICNTPLEEVGRREVRDLVPEFIYLTHEEFGLCPRCNKFYWKGTHWKGVDRVLERFLKSPKTREISDYTDLRQRRIRLWRKNPPACR